MPSSGMPQHLNVAAIARRLAGSASRYARRAAPSKAIAHEQQLALGAGATFRTSPSRPRRAPVNRQYADPSAPLAALGAGTENEARQGREDRRSRCH
jgi:hypothetical protein